MASRFLFRTRRRSTASFWAAAAFGFAATYIAAYAHARTCRDYAYREAYRLEFSSMERVGGGEIPLDEAMLWETEADKFLLPGLESVHDSLNPTLKYESDRSTLLRLVFDAGEAGEP